MLSMLSVFLSGSNITRLLKHGMDGHTEEMVDVSWMAKPCGRSSRCMTLRTPPDFGVWLPAGVAAGAAAASVEMARTATTRRRDMEPPAGITALSLRSVSEKTREQMHAMDGAAREPADHGAVHADVLEIVARVLLDHAHGALG